MTRVRPLLRWCGAHATHVVGISLALVVILASFLVPVLGLSDPARQDLRTSLVGPSAGHLLGTDQLGRDIFSRVLWAGRTSITAALIILVLSLGAGLVVGILAGFTGGFVDNLCMRLVDVFLSFPSIILALALIGTLGPGFGNLILALSITWWPSYARLVRSKVLSLRTMDFVVAAETLGAGRLHIMRKHLLPALIGPVIVLMSLDIGFVILAIAGLGFLGMGIQPPSPEWGTMLVDARPFMQFALHMVLPPGVAILIMIFGCSSLSEALEEWFNPDARAR